MTYLTMGLGGSNSHIATKKYLKSVGLHDKIQFRKSFYDVTKDVTERPELYSGILAFENSKGGLVQDTIEALDIYRPKINGECFLPITHCLAFKEDLGDVREIVSHRQALRQCGNFLRNDFPSCKTREVNSTSYAAKMASKNKKTAAICTELAAEINNLPNLIKNIQDSENNITRFISISNKDQEKITGHDKTLIRYEVKNEPASLYNAIGVFAKRSIDLTMQHSIPTGESGRYIMMSELVGHRLDCNIENALQDLKKYTLPNSIYLYGSYPRTENL